MGKYCMHTFLTTIILYKLLRFIANSILGFIYIFWFFQVLKHLLLLYMSIPARITIKEIQDFIFFSHPLQNISILHTNSSGQTRSGCVQTKDIPPDTGQYASLSPSGFTVIFLLQHRAAVKHSLAGGNFSEQVYGGLVSSQRLHSA